MAEHRRAAPRALKCLAWLPLLAVVLGAGNVAADRPTPIEIAMLGPGPARVRVALGSTFPCDSGDNHRIIDGKFEPGEMIRASTPDRCVCFQQTYEPFTDSDWVAASMVCRPQICSYAGKRKCVPAPDPTIRLQVRSQRPE